MFDRRSFAFALAATFAIALAGCGYTEPEKGEEVDVTGTVTGVDLKKYKDVRLQFMSAGGKARPAQFKLDASGKFSGKMVKGPYRYFLCGPEGPDSTYPGMPEELQQSGSTKREIEVKGGEIDAKF